MINKQPRQSNWFLLFGLLTIGMLIIAVPNLSNLINAKADVRQSTTDVQENPDSLESWATQFRDFEPVLTAPKHYIRPGDRYSADIFLSPYHAVLKEDLKIFVNGYPLPVKEGKAHFEASTGASLGPKQLHVRVLRNNLENERIDTFEKQFEYIVGQGQIFMEAIQMNALYIGVDNPIVITSEGIPFNDDLKVIIKGAGGTISKASNTQYNVKVTKPGQCTITVNDRYTKTFHAKRIPNPVAHLGHKNGGVISVGEFKAQGGVITLIENFFYDVRCTVQKFKMIHIPKGDEPIEIDNVGERFTEESKLLINHAQPGDYYLFYEIKAKCPGDLVSRRVNTMAFIIHKN